MHAEAGRGSIELRVREESALATFAVLVLALLALAPAWPAAAALRDGIDCNCTKTGAYAGVSKGSTLKDPVDASLVVISASEAQSANGTYTLTEGSVSGQTTLTIAATGNSTTLLRLQFLTNGSESWGFSPDEDRFLFTFHNAAKPAGVQTIRLYDLTALSSTSGPALYETDLDGGWSAQFTAKGGRLVLRSTGGTNGPIFRVVDPSTGGVVFHQGFLAGGTVFDTAADFDFLTTPFGFSPNGSYFLYHDVSGTPQRHYVRLYDLTAPAATQTLAYDNAEGTAVLRFSSNSAYLLDVWGTGTNATSLQVRETVSGALAYSNSFTFVPNPGNVGDKFKGAAWGFSPRAGNLLYAVDAGASAVELHLVNLGTGVQVALINAPDVTSSFWRFSRCGDVLATVLQSGGSQLVGNLYSTQDGSLLYNNTSALTLLWQFQSTVLEHQVSVDGGVWQAATTNDAGGACTPPVPDTTPPVWDSGATLTATQGATQGEVDLVWAPAATDADSALALYAIYQDGGEIATVPAGTLAYTVTGLASSAAYTFKVEAEDAAPAANRTHDGPSASITLPDFAPPGFAPGDTLVVNNLGPTSLDLAWPAASDDSGVSEYRVYRGGSLQATLAGDALGLSLTGLDWGSDYRFEVEAADAAGNVSGRLTLDVTTAGPPASAQPPAWPGGAILAVTVTGPETVDLSWPAASGPDGVGAYDVYLNGQRVAQVANTQTSFSLSGLLPDTDWAFEIVPRNTWRQPGSALSGAGHTEPGTHVDPPIPTVGVSGNSDAADAGRISNDGRYLTYTDSGASLYDRVTGQTTGIENALLSGDGRHMVRPDIVIENVGGMNLGRVVGFTSIALDTSAATPLYEVAWGPEPSSRSSLLPRDVSDAGDRLLVQVDTAVPGETFRFNHLFVADGSPSSLSHVALIGRACSYQNNLGQTQTMNCEYLAGALLSPDGESVIYWGADFDTATQQWARGWIRRYTRSGGGTRTLEDLSGRYWGNKTVGPGSTSSAGVVVFSTVDGLLPQDSPRTSGPVRPYDVDIYALDLVTDTLELVSVDAAGNAVGGRVASVSGDGRFVAFEGGVCGQSQIAVHDRWLGTTRCMPIAASGFPSSPIISANGRYIMVAYGDGGLVLMDLAWQRPSWPAGAATIVMTGHDFTSIDFTWPPIDDPAQFPGAILEYKIYQDGVWQGEVFPRNLAPGTLPSYSATGLRPATAYSFEVEVLDATNTETHNGPQAVLSTMTPSADVSLSIVDSPDPIGTATRVRYDITLSNAGPDTAFDAAFDFSWPAGFGFLAANPMAGSCERPAPDSLSCVVGDLPVGGSVQVVVLLSTGAQGTAAVTASASSLGGDPVSGNSSGVQESTEVVPRRGISGAGMVSSAPRSAGSVVAWGDSTDGKTSPPASIAQRTARVVAAGVSHSCAIQAETAAVVCWGSNNQGESSPPPSVDGTDGTVTALAAGDQFSCAIQAGTQAVVCWGLDGYGQATPPASVNGISGGATAIAVGWNHACAIRADTGAVVCWGVNGDFQGDVPSSVNGGTGTASAIAVGLYHSCAIQVGSGSVVCWGAFYSDFGQLAVPPEVDGTIGAASALEAGSRDTCAIQAGSGKVFCWGANWFGLSPPPSSVDGTSGRASALAVADGACAIQAETHAVVCWGGSLTASPSQVSGSAGTALAIAGRQSHFCAIQAGTHAVVCWGGFNSSGETSVLPAVNGSGGLATAVAAGAHHSCAIAAASGAVTCWGALGGNDFGQTSVPPDVDGTMGTASALALGALHSCAIQRASGAVFCWGSGADNQTTVPADVNGSLGTARGIAAGGLHSCAIRDGTNAVVCWGGNAAGQANVPLSVDGTNGTASALAAGTAHSCAIQAETGNVVCWGDNANGRSTPPPAVDGTDGTASVLAVGDRHSCAIQAGSGAVICWGDNVLGQSTPPPGVDGSTGHAIAIAAGLDYSCALQAGSRALLCWGDSALGKTAAPASLDGESGHAVGLAAGESHGLALYVPEPDAWLLGLTALLVLALLRRAWFRRPGIGVQ